MSSAAIDFRLRRFLLGVVVFIFLGTLVELLLEEHTQEPAQFIPFALCILGLLAVGAALIRPHRSTVLALRGIMTLIICGSISGIVLHLYNNYAFELEIRPNAGPADVIKDALMGANPLLAPGILALAGVLAIAATYYHPAPHRGDMSRDH